MTLRDLARNLGAYGRVANRSKALVVVRPRFQDLTGSLRRIRQLGKIPKQPTVKARILKPIIQILASRAVQRLVEYNGGNLEYLKGRGSATQATAPNSRLSDLSSDIASDMVQIEALPGGGWGFASRRRMDRTSINTSQPTRLSLRKAILEGVAPTFRRGQSSVSEYHLAWMIAEFGTGWYADPMFFNNNRHTKVPGGNGAWYLNPLRKGPTIIGQTPGDFILLRRQNASIAGEELEMAAKAIYDSIIRGFRTGEYT